MKKRNIPLILFAIALIAQRLLLYFSVESSDGNIENLYVGTIAKSLIEGLIMPYWDYQFSSYDGGGLFTGILAVPIFLIFGYTSFSLSIVAILFSLGTYFFWYLLLKKYFSERIANIFSIIFIFSPYLFLRWSLVLGANHKEISFFMAAFLYFFYDCFFAPQKLPKDAIPMKKIFFLGFIGGAGIWYCYSFLVMLLVCLMCWFIYCRRVTFLNMISFFSGFVLGICPVLFRLNTFKGDIQDQIFSQLLVLDSGHFLLKLKGFLYINISGKPSIFMNLYWLIAIFSIAVLIWKNKSHLLEVAKCMILLKKVEIKNNSNIVAIVSFPIVYVFIYCLSNFDVFLGDTSYTHYRYYLPMFPFIFANIAIAIGYILNSKRVLFQKIGIFLIGFMLCLSLGDVILNKSDLSAPKLSNYNIQGYSYEMLGTVFAWRFKSDPQKVEQLISLSDEQHREAIYRGLGLELGIVATDDEIKKIIGQGIHSEYITAFVNAVVMGYARNNYAGTELSESYPLFFGTNDREKILKNFRTMAIKINSFDERYKASCFEGLGIQFIASSVYGVDKAESLALYVNADYRDNFNDGLNVGKSIMHKFLTL